MIKPFSYSLTVIIVFAVSLSGLSQSISGTINSYHKVISIGGNNASVEVPSASGLAVGDTVLIIQMQGAQIYSANNAGYGAVIDYNGSGYFEYAIICNILANTVSFNEELSNNYDQSATVQIVSVPNYGNATITGTLTCQPWNGSTGGIVILNASGTLTFNANIDVSNSGFRGGISDSSIYDCAWFDNFSNYTYDITTGHGAMKGEGIAFYGTNTAGKGALANGGGGGNDHNSGGGGGGNLTSGGDGGENNDANPNNCTGNHPGVGGKSLNDQNTRVFLGGGGGAGHANNHMITDGGAGGGIVIIMANNIAGNSNKILANGAAGGISIHDGGGGGGAGGSILLYTDEISNTLRTEAIGGDGGNAGGVTANRCYGPGGGGSGGVIWYKTNSAPSNLSINLAGGSNGLVTSLSTSCLGLSNGADSGQDGVENNKLEILTNAEYETMPNANLGEDKAICDGDIITLSSAEGNNFEWSTGSNEESIEVEDPGTYYLSIYSGACISRDTITISQYDLPENNLPTDTILCSYLGVDLETGNPDDYVIWSTGETSHLINVLEEGKYSATLTNDDGCSIEIEVIVSACTNNLEIPNLITPNGDGNNDTWIIETIYSYPGNMVEIYNRNGALLFQMENYNNTWNADNLPAAAYFYVIDYNNGGNKQQGSISIVREK